MTQLKELLFKKTQELKVQKDKEKCVLGEIEGSRSSLKNLKSQLQRLDADALKQQELIYNQVNINVLSYYDCFLGLIRVNCLSSVIFVTSYHFGNAMQYYLKSAFLSLSRCMDKIEIT